MEENLGHPYFIRRRISSINCVFTRTCFNGAPAQVDTLPLNLDDEHVGIPPNDVAVVEDPLPAKVGGLQGFVQIFSKFTLWVCLSLRVSGFTN